MPSLPIIFSELIASERSPYVFKNRVQNLLWHDVHKTFVVACIASTDSKGVTTYESHHFSTYMSGLKDPKPGLPIWRP